MTLKSLKRLYLNKNYYRHVIDFFISCNFRYINFPIDLINSKTFQVLVIGTLCIVLYILIKYEGELWSKLDTNTYILNKFIGQTGRKLKTCVNEHINHINRNTITLLIITEHRMNLNYDFEWWQFWTKNIS